MLWLLGVDLANNADWTETGFYDAVGGYHSEGIGFSPTGEWCGECCFESCEQCKNYAQNKSI